MGRLESDHVAWQQIDHGASDHRLLGHTEQGMARADRNEPAKADRRAWEPDVLEANEEPIRIEATLIERNVPVENHGLAYELADCKALQLPTQSAVKADAHKACHKGSEPTVADLTDAVDLTSPNAYAYREDEGQANAKVLAQSCLWVSLELGQYRLEYGRIAISNRLDALSAHVALAVLEGRGTLERTAIHQYHCVGYHRLESGHSRPCYRPVQLCPDLSGQLER